jgi:GNAT superfamily N-acetyltransferase
MEYIIRKGEERDLPEVLGLIKELAAYEKYPDHVEITVEQLKEDGFGDNPSYGLEVAEKGGKVVGIALYYTRYSTWKGRKLYLEDLVVTEEERGSGIGKALFDRCIELTREGEYHSLVWQVLDWNEPAINFYRKYNAQFDGEWLDCSIIPG